VVEDPPGSGPGTVNDAFFRFVVDMGGLGPDKGKGEKYLIVPPGYKAAPPKEGYFVARSPSYVNMLVLRGFLVDGKLDATSKTFREGVKVYPLARAANPPKMEFFKRLEGVVQHRPCQQFREASGQGQATHGPCPSRAATELPTVVRLRAPRREPPSTAVLPSDARCAFGVTPPCGHVHPRTAPLPPHPVFPPEGAVPRAPAAS
jgi:Protein of unknown function (DUF1254)